MPSREIAVRTVVTFWNDPDKVPVELVLDRPLPKNTIDPRVAACTNHRVACDCREAVLAEDLSELRAERDLFIAVMREALAGHATRAYTSNNEPDEQAECKCTACGIVRRLPFYIGGYVITRRTSDDAP
jgi:hypothetical protein